MRNQHKRLDATANSPLFSTLGYYIFINKKITKNKRRQETLKFAASYQRDFSTQIGPYKKCYGGIRTR